MFGDYILAIDPGNVQSAYVILDSKLIPISFGKMDNEFMYCEVVDNIVEILESGGKVDVAIEMIASYGMPVGVEVFDTVRWIGKLEERLKQFPVKLIYRREEKLNLCHSAKANDATIVQALIDRFAPGVPNKGKGTKKQPGWFYGFKKDIWQAYAVGVTYRDLYQSQSKEN